MAVTTVVASPTLPTTTTANRHVVRRSTGRLYVAHRDAASLRLSYSDDQGGAWNLCGNAITADDPKVWSLFIDKNNRMFCAWVNQSDHCVFAWTGVNAVGTNPSWSELDSFENYTYVSVDVCAFFENGFGRMFWAATTSGGQVYAGVFGETTAGDGGWNNNHYWGFRACVATSPVAIDFAHTGDGKTAVTGLGSHLWLAYVENTDDLVCVRIPRSSSSWTDFPSCTPRVLDTSVQPNGPIAGVFDGARFIVAAADATASTIVVYERNSGDTATTQRTPPALSDGDVDSLAVTSNADDFWLAASGQTSDDPKWVLYDRSANSWGAWAAHEATTVVHPHVAAERCSSAVARHAILWSTAAAVRFEQVGANRPPNTPTWDTADNTVFESAVNNQIDWTHSDLDGDVQAGYKLRRSVNGGAFDWWTGAGWGAEVWRAAGNEYNGGINGSAGQSWALAVKTRDADLAESDYSATLNLTFVAKVNPTITAPVDEGTTSGSTMTATWTVGEQTAYRAVLKSGDGVTTIEDSGWVASATTSHIFTSTLANGTAYDVEVTTQNNAGLASNTAKSDTTTSFTPPDTPTLTTSTVTNAGAITVTIDNPAGGTAVTSNDLYVRVAAGGVADGERPVAGNGIRIATSIAADGTYIDWAVASGISYEYKVVAKASSNGTSAEGAWT